MAEIRHHPNIPVKKPIAVALSLQEAEWENLTAIANNISNAFHPGYKAAQLKFKEVLYKTRDGEKISYMAINGMKQNFSDGSLKLTSNPLDVALTGDGFFGVATPNGVRYTRNGQFTRDANGVLVMSANGYAVTDDGGGEIRIPDNAKDIRIGSDGRISFDGVPGGRLGVFNFGDNPNMKRQGDSLFESLSEPGESGQYRISQFNLEESNVSPIKETIRMMQALRSYEGAQKVIDEHEKILQRTMQASARNA